MNLFIANFRDDMNRKHERKFRARHVTHAYHKALGLARSNNWKLIGEVGLV